MATHIFFLARNQKRLTSLQGQVEALRDYSGRTPGGFYRLYKSMEAYRDFIRDSLDSLSVEARARAEDQLPPLFPLAEEAHKLAIAAQKVGVIPGYLADSIGLVGNSLLFVSVQLKVMVA